MQATSPSAERLARFLTGGDDADPQTRELAAWLGASPRFRRFAEAYRDKVRKKLRVASDAEARLDVRAELRVADLLLADRRINLEFEPNGSARGGPDFAMSFRDRPACFLEVTRLRGLATEPTLARVLVAKLRQLPPGRPTVLVVAVDARDASQLPLTAVVRSVRGRADANDPELMARGGFEDSRAFYGRFLRLGAVIGWCESGSGDGRAALWTNRSAQLELPDAVARACLSALRSSGAA